jgi:hypothetical protein
LREKLLAEQASRACHNPPKPQTHLQANVGAANGDPTDVPPDGRPGSPWGMPVGTKAAGDASPVFRAWLEHEGPEPET